MRNRTLLYRGLALFIISAVFLIITGCAVASIVSQFGYVRGIVTDADTGDPISGVFVSAGGYYYEDDYDYTDSDGSYVLTLGTGTYDIYFEKDGYNDKELHDIGVFAPFTQSRDVQMESYNPQPTPTPTPYDTLLFATETGSNRFDAVYLNTDSGTLALDANSPIGTGNSPAGIVHMSTKSRVAVANQDDGTISVYKSSGQFLQVSGSPLSLSAENGSPYKMVFDSITNRIFIAMKNSSSPGKVETVSMSSADSPVDEGLIDAPALADDPQDLEIHNGNRNLFIASRSGNKITAYDIPGAKVNGEIAVTDPAAIAVDVERNRVYVAEGSTGKIITLDVSDPANMSRIEPETTAVTESGNSLIDCETAPDRNLLFTLEGGSTYKVKGFNINASPPYAEAVTGIDLGSVSTASILYDEDTGFLFIAHNSTGTGGIIVYDCRSYPGSNIFEVSGSPFIPGTRFFMMDK